MPRVPQVRFAYQLPDDRWWLTDQPPNIPVRSGKLFETRKDLQRYCRPEGRDGVPRQRYSIVWESRAVTGKLVLQWPEY